MCAHIFVCYVQKRCFVSDFIQWQINWHYIMVLVEKTDVPVNPLCLKQVVTSFVLPYLDH